MIKIEDLKPGQGICIKSGDPRRYLVGRLGYLGKQFLNGAPEGHVVVSFDHEVDHTCSHGVALEHLELVDLDIVIKAMLDRRVGALDPQGLLEAAKRAWPEPYNGMDKYELLLEFLTKKYAYDYERRMKRGGINPHKGGYLMDRFGNLFTLVKEDGAVVLIQSIHGAPVQSVALSEFKTAYKPVVRGEWA